MTTTVELTTRGFKKRTIRICAPRLGNPEVPALVLGDWAVHRPHGSSGSASSGYNVTHVPTGLGINAYRIDRLDVAKRFASGIPSTGLPPHGTTFGGDETSSWTWDERKRSREAVQYLMRRAEQSP